jgi:outer membrane lipoprotein carrier protein
MRHASRRAACAALAFAATIAGAQDGLARAQRYLDEVDTLSARFSQTLVDPGGRIVDEAQGTLQIKRPGRFRWNYETPHEQLVVADGEKLWLYDPGLEQVTVKALDATLGSTPAMLLGGSGKLSDAYDVAREYEEDGLSWVELAPRAKQGDFRKVRLAFAGDELKGMELEDTLDQVTRIRFSDVERDPPLADDLFRFLVPPGTDVVGDAPAEAGP